MVGAAVLFAVLVPAQVIVLDARIQGEEPAPVLAAELARALGAPAPAEGSARLAQRLPAVAGGSKTEPVLEADQLVERGRDAYLDGKFEKAKRDLSRAREVLSHAIDSFEEEGKASDAWFRAHMYLAFTLRSQGGSYVTQAVEVLKDAIRTFGPGREASYSEFGPENVRFYNQVLAQMEQGPMARLRVETGRETAGVYLNGRLVGVTPLDLPRVFPGHYRLHLRRGAEPSRLHEVDIKAGDNRFTIDLELDRALRTDGELALLYANAARRKGMARMHAAQVAKLLEAEGALVFWRDGGRVHLAYVDADGNSREVDAAADDAARLAPELRAGRTGELVKGGGERPRRVWTWVAGGVAVAAITTGVLLGISANGDYDTLTARYPSGMLDRAGVDLRDSVSAKQTAGNVLVDLGIVAAAGAALLCWYEGRSVSLEHAQFLPAVGPTLAGAQLRVGF